MATKFLKNLVSLYIGSEITARRRKAQTTVPLPTRVPCTVPAQLGQRKEAKPSWVSAKVGTILHPRGHVTTFGDTFDCPIWAEMAPGMW